MIDLVDHGVDRDEQGRKGRFDPHRSSHEFGALESGLFEKGPNILLDETEPVLIDQIALRQGDHCMIDPEQGKDIHVFTGLRHDPLVRGYGYKNSFHTRNPGDHVSDEPFVAGYIDKSDTPPPGRFEMGEPELDGDAPFFFLCEAIRVRPCDRFAERGLAVIDVTGGTDGINKPPPVAILVQVLARVNRQWRGVLADSWR